MADLNSVNLVGRLTRGAELKYTGSGTPVTKLGLAVNRRTKKGEEWTEEASFFDIVVWGRQGEALNPYLVKGKQLAIKGRLQQDRWEKDGQKKSRVLVVAEDVQLLGGGSDKDNGLPGERKSQESAPPAGRQPKQDGNDWTPEGGEDIPF